MRTDYIDKAKYDLLYLHMTYDNALALRTSVETGLRISDVLSLKPSDIGADRISFVAQKTGKAGTARVSLQLASLLRKNGSDRWVFPHRNDPYKHRARQTVWKDVKAAAALLELDGVLHGENVAPHSGRKTFAVEDKRRYGVAHTQEALQHSSRSTTEIYSESDKLVGVPPSYKDLTVVLQRLNTIDKKINKLIELLQP